MGDTAGNTRQRVRTVAILLYDGVQSLDVTGPAEVFAGAAHALRAKAGDGRGTPGYRVRTIARGGRPVRSTSGLQLVPDGPVPRTAEGIDTLIVPGGEGHVEACGEEALLRWLARSPSGCRRVASVCTGSFLLAAAGLLDGRRATTHWAYARELARLHPLVDVQPDPIFVRDGSIWTSAGVTAGMDLALALVEEDHDRELALLIARHLVLFLRRPGNQSQFSALLRAQEPDREPLRKVQRQVLDDVAGLHTVEAMAERVHMSPRNFARAFRAQTGVTPARYVESVRLEAARRRLEDTTEPLQGIARACGFGSAETMRRSFLRALHVGPSEYRRRFHSSFAAARPGRRGHVQRSRGETLPPKKRRNR